MGKNREKIKHIVNTLELLGKQYDFRNLETAIVIWLRGNLSNYNDKTLEELDEMIYNHDGSLLNDDIKNYIDNL